MRGIGNQKGFTLLELMMVVGISTIISYSIFLALGASDTQTQTSSLKMNIQDSAREGLYKMAQEIRQSASSKVTITAPMAGYEVIQFNIPNTSTPVNTNPADGVTDYTVDWATSDLIQYARGGTSCDKIIRTVCAGGACPVTTCPCTGSCTDTLASNQKIVATDVSSLDFDGTSQPGIVLINMNTQRNIYSRGTRSLMVDSSGTNTPLVMTAKAEMRNA